LEKLTTDWADYTFNPWIGCTKVSDGCRECYAHRQQDLRFGRVEWGDGNPRSRTSTSYWEKPKLWDWRAYYYKNRPFVSCGSLCDVFDPEVSSCWRDDLFRLIEETPHLVWLLLTRRISEVVQFTERLPNNVALGVSISSQDEYNRDAPLLREAALKLHPIFTFGNFEPLLAPVTLDYFTAPKWVIVGCETGPLGRFMMPDWARNLRDQSAVMGLSFYFKQASELRSGPSDLLDGAHHRNRPNTLNREWLLGHRDWLDKLLSDTGYRGPAPDCSGIAMPERHHQPN